jgi:signal transduction histidine kinase
MRARLVVRVTAPIVAFSVLLLAVGVGTAWYTNRLQKSITEQLTLDISGVRAAEELVLALRDVESQSTRFLLTGERTQLDAISALGEKFNPWLSEAERLATTDSERGLVNRMKQSYPRMLGEFSRIDKENGGDRLPENIRGLIDEVLEKELLPAAHEYLHLQQETVASTDQRNESIAETRGLGVLLLGTCGSVAGLLAGFGIARGVSRSMVQLSVPIRDSLGKLNEVVGPITLSAGWGFEELEIELRRMADHIGTVVERLQQSQREVLHAEQLAAVGQLAAGVAHELRNPLMSMKILVQSAAEQGDSMSLRGRDLAVLEEEISRLEHSIQTFLDFARPPLLEKRRFELRTVLEQTVELLSSRADQQGVRIECKLLKDSTALEADMGQIRQVLLNLLLNALDAVPEGGTIWVRVSSESRASQARLSVGEPSSTRAKEWLTIEVGDTGGGLPADLGARIFEPFVSAKETGTGLGLSICKRIVEAHGGEIDAANLAAGGAVFSVRLPLLVEPEATEPCNELTERIQVTSA